MPQNEVVSPQVSKPQPSRPPLDTELKRYHRSFRRRLRKFAKTSAVFGDLVYTFPALAIVIATGQGDQAARREAIVRAAAGEQLRRVADAVGMPMWLRNLPPEAFVGSVPQVPTSEAFSRQVANIVPRKPAHAAMWLNWVVMAHRLAGESFAAWIASQRIYTSDGPEPHCLWPLAAFAWYSSNGGGAARGLIRRPWNPRMGFQRAVEQTRSFLLRVMLEECRDDCGAWGRWYTQQRASGYRIVPLRTLTELEQEGERMNNCVAQYAHAVARGECLIYGIRRANRHVATLEIRPHWGKGGTPVVTQLEGPGNGLADDDVRRAVEKWLSRQGGFPIVAPKQLAGVPVDDHRWTALWEPYWQAIGQTRTRRQVPVITQLAHLNASLDILITLAKLPRV